MFPLEEIAVLTFEFLLESITWICKYYEIPYLLVRRKRYKLIVFRIFTKKVQWSLWILALRGWWIWHTFQIGTNLFYTLHKKDSLDSLLTGIWIYMWCQSWGRNQKSEKLSTLVRGDAFLAYIQCVDIYSEMLSFFFTPTRSPKRI